MKTFENLLLVALGLIALFLVLDKNGGKLITDFSKGLADVFRVLQGRG